MTKRIVSVAVLCIVSGLGCGKKVKNGSPVLAKLALANATTQALALACPDLGGGNIPSICYTPAYYGLKILNVIVSPDAEGAKTAPAGLIWSNPECTTTVQSTEINGKKYEYESVSDACNDDKIDNYFDLARETAVVNADLNSQDHKILPGTYNYVQITFCIGGPKSNNASFKADAMTEAYSVKSNQCGVSSVKAETPIVVAEGEAVTISLSYNLDNIIYRAPTGQFNSSNCSGTAEADSYCFGYPQSLVPSFAKR